ncbi:MAG: tetratricopeptide repeat protein, partial [Planctomycetes bacterium]|nr:tetratricopeptide repeat protein [Planctomycetota bacterium]
LQAKKGMALSLLKVDQPKQALAVYREILAQNPELAEVWNNVGVITMNLKRLKDAEQALLQAIEIRPRYASAHSNLGAVYQRMGRVEDAKRHAAIALEIDPDNLAASYNSIL